MLTMLLSDLTQTSLVKRAESLFDQGDKNGKLLAILVADQRAQNNIPCIKIDQGVLVTDHSDIMDIFVQFYFKLYAQLPAYSEEELERLLSCLSMRTLLDIDRDLFEADITEDEIEVAIRGVPPHKAPGPDGFTIEWYRQHLTLLVPRPKSLFHYCLENGLFPSSLMEAHIILRPPEPGSENFKERISK